MHNPTLEELAETAQELGLHLTNEQLAEYRSLMAAPLAAYDVVNRMPDELPVVKYPRTPGHAPAPEDNPYHAWYYRSEIHGADAGPLKGRTLAVKDNIAVAGVPMMNGSATLRGYVPDVDATVVTRILDAGGTILGKSHCELFCFSGGSHTNSTGAVINPRKPGHSAGGSSSGSAALVAAGAVDMALGTDQGGSVRMPSSYCGTVGMKPTFGLVPYTGGMSIEATMDHIGPITRTVADNALLLSVIAGEDGLDARQHNVRKTDYAAEMEGGVRGMRIGVVREGFGLPESEPDVDRLVRQAGATFARLGATVEEVSIPMHSVAGAVWSAIVHEGAVVQILHTNGQGSGWKGLYLPGMMQAQDAWRLRADDFSETVKVTVLLGQYMWRKYHGLHYARAQNLLRRVVAAYDAVLAKYDLLLMPTTPMKATPLPGPDAGITENVQRGLEMLANTAPFDATGHPAISIPCGVSDGLPVGLMLVGPFWGEGRIYRAAKAFEGAGVA
ncbi:MAG: amidase [Nevskiaceae bacterium]|nr:MAG: amidase [Nevskiaceae bacterium]TBR74416.1 MAG: amidase [Nevskiaceae bacterium]